MNKIKEEAYLAGAKASDSGMKTFCYTSILNSSESNLKESKVLAVFYCKTKVDSSRCKFYQREVNHYLNRIAEVKPKLAEETEITNDLTQKYTHNLLAKVGKLVEANRMQFSQVSYMFSLAVGKDIATYFNFLTDFLEITSTFCSQKYKYLESRAILLELEEQFDQAEKAFYEAQEDCNEKKKILDEISVKLAHQLNLLEKVEFKYKEELNNLEEKRKIFDFQIESLKEKLIELSKSKISKFLKIKLIHLLLQIKQINKYASKYLNFVFEQRDKWDENRKLRRLFKEQINFIRTEKEEMEQVWSRVDSENYAELVEKVKTKHSELFKLKKTLSQIRFLLYTHGIEEQDEKMKKIIFGFM